MLYFKSCPHCGVGDLRRMPASQGEEGYLTCLQCGYRVYLLGAQNASETVTERFSARCGRCGEELPVENRRRDGQRSAWCQKCREEAAAKRKKEPTRV